MAEWFFFGTLLMVAIVVYILFVHRKNHSKKINELEDSPAYGINELIDKIDRID